MGRVRGFTLIELMIVVGMIGILSLLSLSSYVGGMPARRASGGAREVFGVLQQARARAIRTGQPQKVCVFSSSAANATFNAAGAFPARGGALLVACRPGAICSDANDLAVCAGGNASGVDATKVGPGLDWDFPANITPITGSPLPNIVTRLGNDNYPETAVSAYQNNAGTVFTSPSVFEISFSSLGTVEGRATSENPTGTPATSGSIVVGSVDGRHVRVISWSPAGAIRLR